MNAVDSQSLDLIFQAVRKALPAALSERVLAEQCVRDLCRVPARGAFAADVLVEVLLSGDAAPSVREVLLAGLKELGHRDGLPAILASLPHGGPSIEADAVGKAAYTALLAVLRVAAERGEELDVEVGLVDRALAQEEPAWACWFAGRMMEQLDRYDEAEPQHAIRLAFARATLAQRDATQFERAYSECEWVALQTPAGVDRGAEARRVLIALAELIGPRLAPDAALYGEELLRELVDSAERQELCVRVAKLLFAAGDWEGCYHWLDREIEEASGDVEVLLLKAKAAARREDVNATRDALRLHELLCGPVGRGGLLQKDEPRRTACELTLVRLLCDAGRDADARALLIKLPAAAALSPELQAERRRIEARLAAERG